MDTEVTPIIRTMHPSAAEGGQIESSLPENFEKNFPKHMVSVQVSELVKTNSNTFKNEECMKRRQIT